MVVAEVLVWANLRGVDTHGVTRIPRYVELIEQGDMNPRPEIRIRSETAAAVLIEADRAAGPVAMMRGVSEAMRKARDAGVGLALVRATTHTAALGYYTLEIAKAGMAGTALAGSWPNVIYHGSKAAGVSTSPISIAVPGGEPVVLDMATSIVSMGKLNQAKKAGKSIPEGWALDAEGRPTTDPQSAQTPLPMGGAKGSGLSFMVECLASLIASNPLLAESLERTPAGARHRQNGFVLAIDLSPVRRSGELQEGSGPPSASAQGAATRRRHRGDPNARRARASHSGAAYARRHSPPRRGPCRAARPRGAARCRHAHLSALIYCVP